MLIGRLGTLAALALAVARAEAAGGAEAVAGAGIDVRHYALTLRPDFATHRVAGTATIDFLGTSDGLFEVVFTPNALGVTRASVDGTAVEASRRADGWAFALPRPLRAGQAATLSIAFEGTPARGLVFGPRSVVSSYFTCDWMFCAQDRPGDKATFALTLLLPRGFTSIGPGRQEERRREPDGGERHVWRETRPYSSYVFGFAAGAFQRWQERRDGTTFLALGEGALPARLRALFAPTAEMARFFAARAGLPLPHGRYVQVLVPADEAQEAAPFSVLGEEVVAARLRDPQEDWAIAHELAHQWWGNLVTCRDWTHFWLNEGLTSFMVAAWKEHRWGRAAYEHELQLFARRRETAVKAGLDVPLTYPGPWPSLAVRRAITYSKAALFLDRLRSEMGEAAFWAGLRDYTRAHAGGIVESRNFQEAMEKAAGRGLGVLFKEWVY